MAEPPISPKGASSKKKKQLMIIGGAGLVLVLFLYMRSRSSSSATPNATNATDQQAAVNAAVAQQQQQDASLYGSQAGLGTGGYGSGGGSSGTGSTIDTSGITSGLSTLDSDLLGVQAGLAGLTPTSAAAAPPAPSVAAATATPPITINVNGQPAATKPGGTGPRMSTLTAAQANAGYVALPFGATKPAAKAGFTAVGLGSGNWGEKKAAAPAKTGRSGGAPLTKKK
jgi:hypothetical protein